MYIQDNQFKRIEINLPIETSQAKREEQIDIIFKILSKDVNHIKDTIKVILEMELKSKWKSKEIASLLLNLRVAEEYQRFTDSEYADIVESAYKLNSHNTHKLYVLHQLEHISQ
ncbi:unnamed protein product [marine sediment metagenome]|uniref:Uncharacterized protein n=1 Tax=marine sediment metagenome TaxID=412755 RepID=X1CJA5_9ZZZZ